MEVPKPCVLGLAVIHLLVQTGFEGLGLQPPFTQSVVQCVRCVRVTAAAAAVPRTEYAHEHRESNRDRNHDVENGFSRGVAGPPIAAFPCRGADIARVVIGPQGDTLARAVAVNTVAFHRNAIRTRRTSARATPVQVVRARSTK